MTLNKLVVIKRPNQRKKNQEQISKKMKILWKTNLFLLKEKFTKNQKT